MISTAIVARYASALADVVTGPAGVDAAQATGQLRAFAAVLAGSAELRNALGSPAVSPARKRAVVGRLADQLAVVKVVRNFLQVLSDHRRLDGLTQMIDRFEILLDERLGFIRADLRTACDLDEKQKAALADELSSLTGKKVRPRFAVEPELIGGVVARIGSTVYDGSVRGQLDALARRLATE
jgi:F-type H+-transporting ATPase subunit delta